MFKDMMCQGLKKRSSTESLSTPLELTGFRFKKCIICPYWPSRCNLPVDCARELFKPSKDLATLLVCS